MKLKDLKIFIIMFQEDVISILKQSLIGSVRLLIAKQFSLKTNSHRGSGRVHIRV